MSVGAMEIEKLTALGEKIGLQGKDLLDFIEKERLVLKQQRDEERRARADEREAQKQEREFQKQQQEFQKQEDERKRQYEIQQAEEQRRFIREQAEVEAKRRNLEYQRSVEQFQRNEQMADNSLLREEQSLDKQVKIEEAKVRQAELMQGSSKGSAPQHKGRVPKLPAFDESKDNIDAYLIRFERYASIQNWPREHWAVDLSALLSGKGLEVYYSLNEDQANDYDTLKRAILNRYELNEEGFRNKFKSSKPETGESGVQYANRILNYFKRWVDLATVIDSKEGIIDLILRDQFIHSVPKGMAMFITERKPSTIDEMADLSDQYLHAHGNWWGPGNPPNVQKGKNARFSSKGSNSKVGSKTNESSQKQGQDGSTSWQGNSTVRPKQRGACFICGKLGHYAKDCRQRPKLNALLDSIGQSDNRPNETQQSETTTECSDKGAFLMITTGQNSDIVPGRSVYTLDCGHQLTVLTAACHRQTDTSMPVTEGRVGDHKIKVLRDTGCTGVVVRESLVKKSQLTGEHKTCVLIDGTVRRFPVAEIEVDTPYFVGKVPALCMANPVYELILGNIDGVREPTDPNLKWKEIHDKEVLVEEKNDESTTDTSLPNEDKEEKAEMSDEHLSEDRVAAVQTRSQCRNKDKPFKPLIVTPPEEEIVTADLLKEKQSADPTLFRPRELAKTGEVKVGKNGSRSSYTIDKGILYREFTAPNVDFGNKFRQVVVPSEYRKHVMKIAHESILGGHQAAKKTSEKVMAHFYWPGLGADIRRYCQSCDTCQRTIPKGRVTKIPLGDMPIIDTPFERVAVDLVGPIKPSTERGHRYILVLMDYATRYPEAVPLKSIEAEVVAEELLAMYTRLGIPKQVLTDRGSQFMSGVMKEVNRLLSIHPLATTPYHAMCNGLVERYNGVLKSMLKKMCEERPRDWDRYICPLLFAYRETPQSSTGFSPFELLYGRSVRGPMQILKELWTGQYTESETKNTYQYVIDLQERLEETCQLAREELRKSKDRYRIQYNKKARSRSFKEGEEVLLLLPTDHNKLLMQWKGPFKIVSKTSVMNYQLDLGKRKQTFHANLLKKYFRRNEDEQKPDEVQGALTIAAVSVIEEEHDDEVLPEDYFRFTNEDLLHLPPLSSKETTKDVSISPNLDNTQVQEVKRMLGNFRDVLTDIPGKTTLGEHAIRLTDTEPVRCKPYPTPHALRAEVQKEVDAMLEMGIVTKSTSPYASPLTMVVKPDGTYRCCVDSRKINARTEFDAEPVPDQEEIFSQLSKDNFFSKIDLSKGYWQIPMEESSKKYTAFITHGGLYQFEVMPFGLVNSAATFSRVMRTLLKGLDHVNNYIDDVLIHTQTWEEHIQLVKEIFRRLRKANLTARPSKCFIGYNEVEFLGHMVGRGVLKPKPEKVEAIRKAVRPETKTQLRSFLGLAGYYRKFIPDFAAIACPLTDCTRKGEPNKIRWGQEQEKAFQTLKSKLTNSPILHLPDLTKPFILRSDASENGIGSVLLQEHMGEKFPVGYASKKLSKCQKAYSVMEKECLAIVWAIQRFEPYLYGREFVIETDHQPLSCLKKSKVANARIMRWALSLQPYRYRIEVIKGSKNVGADYMSRVY